MRARKLTKSIKTKSNPTLNPLDDCHDLTFKTSIDDLKNQPSRQSLRQHFTGAFPETKLRPSLDQEESIVNADMRGKGRLSRMTSDVKTSHDLAGISSSSASSVNSGEVKRLPTVRENSEKIDIGEVINLLQELRSTASPAELVALHKALLPTSDSVINSPVLPPSPEDQAPRVPPPFVRRRSMLPPGVATRNASREPLRSPEQATAKVKKARAHSQPTLNNDLAALDLANVALRATVLRSATPVEQDPIHMGAYRHGTLRITNGAASPDPSIIHKPNRLHSQTAEEQNAREESQAARITLNNYDFSDQHQAEKKHAVKSSDGQDFTTNVLRRETEPLRTDSAIQHQEELRRPGPAFEDACASYDHLPREPHRDTSCSRNMRQSKSSHRIDKLPDKQGSKNFPHQHTEIVSTRRSEPIIRSINDGMPSAIITNTQRRSEITNNANMPRFAQRWSHRLSHVSHEPGPGLQLPSNPHDDHAALHNLSERLSIVTDWNQRKQAEAEATARETPEVALAKLNGEIDRAMSKQTEDDSSADSSNNPISSVEAPHDNWEIQRPEKADSGYGSDVSQRPMEAQQEAREVDAAQSFAGARGSIHRAYEGLYVEDDEVSLYSFNQVMKSPYLLSGLVMPSPPEERGSKKHLSLLGLNSEGRSSTLKAQHNERTNDFTNPTLAEAKSLKLQKKLQKPSPISVQKDRSAEMRQSDEVKSIKLAMHPHTRDDLEKTSSRRPSGVQAMEAASTASTRKLSTDIESQISRDMKSKYQVKENFREIVGNSASTTGPNHSRFEDFPQQADVEIKVNREMPSSANRKHCANIRRSCMEAEMASALARMKSRDVAIQNNGDLFDWARTATPNRKNCTFQSSSRSTVAGITPGVDLTLLFADGELISPRSSITESIPPVPKLPAGADRKGYSLDGSVTQQLEINAQSDPLSSRSTPDRPGDSTESIADVVKRAVEARKSEMTPQMKEDLSSNGVRKSKSKKKLRKIQPTDHRSSIPNDLTAANLEISPTALCRSNSDQPGWEQQVRAWRERRESINQTLKEALRTDNEQSEKSWPENSLESQPIAVSRPIIRCNNEDNDGFKTEHQRSDSAEQHADVYRDLIAEREEQITTSDIVYRQDSTIMTPADQQSNKTFTQDEHIDSTYSIKSYLVLGSRIERSRSPGGRVVTPSGNFHPYTPAGHEQANNSHAVGHTRAISATSQSSTTLVETPKRSLHRPSDTLDSLIDRYSGGFKLKRRSAGMRTNEMKLPGSQQLSTTSGLDLTDIPLNLQKN